MTLRAIAHYSASLRAKLLAPETIEEEMYNAYALKGGYPVTPSDTLPQLPPSGPGNVLMGLYVGTTGSLKLGLEDGSVVTLPTVATGTFTPSMRIVYVYATGTTATNLVGFY